MNKEAIVQKLIESAEILDAQGLHREADAIHEGIRIAQSNQADMWGNIGKFFQSLNPSTWGTKVKDLIDPAFKGLYDNTVAYQEALNEFYLDLRNSTIDDRSKYYLLELMQQVLVSAQKMNPEYYENYLKYFRNVAAPATNAAPVAPAKQRSREELMKSL